MKLYDTTCFVVKYGVLYACRKKILNLQNR